jgi:G6PDH family F420-dependent oxidoreductase
MMEFGYALSSEEHAPSRLVELAVDAERAGFSFALISDHFHPWLDAQGQSGFVWSVIGAIAVSTQSLRLGTGVTCPIIRTHPAIIAHAAATAAELMPGRFFLGLGTGERLNEHVTGEYWPPADVRREMLQEAVEIIRKLWRGELTDYRGAYFTVENARIYSLPAAPPPIYIAASGPNSARFAGIEGDGLISTSPDREILDAYESQSKGPKYGQITVCWAPSEEQGLETAAKYWPNAALGSPLGQELALPSDYKAALERVKPEDLRERVVCGPDAQPYVEMIQKYVDAGFDHVYLHQVGPEQDGFFRFYERELAPRLQKSSQPVRSR